MGKHFKNSLKGGFYQISNALWLYRKELGLSLEDIAIINCIAFHSKGWAINFTEELSDMSESTRNRKLKSLKDKGYLTTERKVYKNGDDFACVGVVCDISALEEKLEELSGIHQNTEQSNMTEKVENSVKYDRINNTNKNNTNSEEVNIFIYSLKERGLDVPRNIGEHLITSLSDREKQYFQFAGKYIEHEIEYGEWENNGKPLYNSLHTLLNPRRKSHFLKFGEEQLWKKEEEEEQERKNQEMVVRAKEQLGNLNILFDKAYIPLTDFQSVLLKQKGVRNYYRSDEEYYIEMINSLPSITVDLRAAKLLCAIFQTLFRDETLNGQYRRLLYHMGSAITYGKDFNFEEYIIKNLSIEIPFFKEKV